jgi:hypothetical protein
MQDGVQSRVQQCACVLCSHGHGVAGVLELPEAHDWHNSAVLLVLGVDSGVNPFWVHVCADWVNRTRPD